ncbi:MAG: magnesium transporter [Oscillospiraceae bacterium]|nr:magnesium transporter [Oscillospiraceae bacterium]
MPFIFDFDEEVSPVAERFEIVQKALLKMLEDKKYATLRDILVTMNPSDIAALFTDLEEKQIPLMFRLLPKEQAAETFVEMEPDEQELLIRGFSDNELKEVLDELYVDDAADIVEEMPANVVKRILKAADPEMRSSINQILRYPDNSAGSIMTTEYVSLRPSMTVEEAILRIRRQGVDKETIYTCYVTDKDRTLIGLVTVKDLLLAEDDETPISEIMLTNLISVTTRTDQEEVAHMFSKYNFLALPVVDGENRMVGIVTFDDAMDVMEEEATEDIEKMSGMLPSEKSYLRSNVFELFKNRIPWLMLMMVSATFTGLIITSFEGALAARVALTAFIPMLMGTGGNSGSQSSVTVIRALSLGELDFRDIGVVLWKEIRTSVLCGVALGVVCFVKIWLVDRMMFGNTDITVMVDLVVCLALCVTVIVAKIVGCLLPMAAKALKLDPAVMASPFISTIVDALSLLVYFLFAKAVLGV